jgi:hypothetical protein
MFVPRSYDGLELDLPAGLEVLVELAKIDGSVGWNAMTSSNGSLFAAFLPQRPAPGLRSLHHPHRRSDIRQRLPLSEPVCASVKQSSRPLNRRDRDVDHEP